MDNLKDVHLNLSCRVFNKMPNLRFLIFTYHRESNKVHLPDGLNSLPDELMILKWTGYPLRTLPLDFSLEKLVKLDLSDSNIKQLWEGTKHAPKLKWFILRYCPRLIRIPNLTDFLSLEEVDLTGCWILVEFPSSVQQLNKLRNLSLGGCSNVTKFPLTSTSIERLNLIGTAIEEVPPSVQSLTNLTELYLSECTRLKNIPTGICKLKSLLTLDLDDCSELETFPEILETMEFLKSLELRGSAIKELPPSIEHLTGLQRLSLSNCKNLEMLPSSICNLSSLEKLYFSNCSKLNKLPDNLGNLKSLKLLSVWGSAIELGGNMFESLPKSIKHLSWLEYLSVRDCNMLQSLTELPAALQQLEAINCKQLFQALPDASEFKHCITSEYHDNVNFSFTNSFNLNQKAVSNVFEESLKGFEKPPIQFSIYLPGSEIPEWFSYQSSGSSVNIQVLRQDFINRKFMGFAICAVIEIDEYHNYECDYLEVGICGHFETCDYPISFPPYYNRGNNKVFINSDHILLGYSPVSKLDYLYQNLEKLFAGDSCDYVDISFEIQTMFRYCKVKHYAVHPIYAEPKEIISATIEDIRETSGWRSGRSDDNEEEVEPHPKRFCTQPNLMLPISNQNP
ncbi:hypothetical protein EZV62_008797 [Acer yangbiense]|uniref:TIR domain-containing protein n=1 Tax=Acer yangbiense TaxID=1000413 RepID=A0A5C7IEX9_9ROSI|nr:hypothetical protein EZV62_008797 [Acer yangbiense]